MIVNRSNLSTLYTAFSTAFRNGLDTRQAEAQWNRVAMRVPSTTRENEYGWLGNLPNVREWLGERVVQNLRTHDYAIKNRDFELTVGVDRNDIEDDNLGIYSTMFEMMGRSMAGHPDQLVFGLLAAGFSTVCYDGQFFFDSDHPVIDANGVVQSVSNTGGGSGTAWYLFDTRSGFMPLIFQERKAPQIVRMDAETDEAVFSRKEFRYGADCRDNVGFGFWQGAYGSKATLDAAAYATAREGMMGRKGDFGRPLGLRPNLLVVPPALEKEGLEILNAERLSSGATNVYRGTAELLVVPWLA